MKGPGGRLSQASSFTVSKEDGAPDGMTIDRCARACGCRHIHAVVQAGAGAALVLHAARAPGSCQWRMLHRSSVKGV